MHKLTITAFILSVITLPVLADPAHGLWKTAPDDNGNFGHVQIQTCTNGKICGGLVSTFDRNGQRIDSTNIGRAIVWDMVPSGNGQYADGNVYAPDRDRTYTAKMDLRDSTLGVSGCIAFLCREASWTRVQ